ncbi:Hsp20/alpha crystallin family protein [Phenylobacterium sp.]|uniref:Hsp20/alpha crystallin family protein n=1 Tax=Phenylobacterium sp. TaxID=1871053 RepID=UPI002B7A515B|nr:Hsp20/alpha crystallin family protein [Phenylobacterium sp.]HVI33569.1 Hsp20/alpha crystallin family protein [Phenylobacterium sp.]
MADSADIDDSTTTLERSPASGFAPLQRELARLVGEPRQGWRAVADFRPVPAMDVVDTDAGVDISVELPGLTRDQVTITAEDDVLTISGEKTAHHADEGDGYRIIERRYGAFSRAIYLPRSLDAERITATMADGVLKIFVPKRPGAETKTIEIQSK